MPANSDNLFKRRSETISREDGFSLLEMLVVLAIMALLATVVAPRLFTQVDKSKVTAAQAQAKTLRLALDAYRLDVGAYPSSSQGLSVLVTPPTNGEAWFGPYMDDSTLPQDPWGNEFVYQEPKRDAAGRQLSPVILSLGSDGTLGGEGDASDITS